MTKFLTSVKALLCVLLLSGSSFAGTVTGQVQTPSGGGFANATFSFTLTQPALVSGTATIAPATVNCYTDANGNVVGEPNPLVIPTVSANLASGTLGAATYFVKITYVDGTGQSVASPEGTLILSSTGTLVVTAPARQPTGATGYNVYISTTTGTETLQGTVTGTPGSWGNFSQASALGAGSALPGSNTTSCKLRFNDELQPSFVCYDVGLISSSGSTLPGYPQYWYLSGGTGGTVNIGVGTPQSTVCQGSGVSYPQSIVAQPIAGATQSIGGGLDLGVFGLAAGSVTTTGAVTGGSFAGGSFTGTSANFSSLTASTFTPTTITTPLLTTGNLSSIIIVDGTKYPMSTAGVNQAITDVSNGGTVIISSLPLILTGCSTTECILINKPMHLMCLGWGGSASGPNDITIGSAVGAAVDAIHIKGTAPIEGVEISGCQTVAQSGTPGRHSVNIDSTSFPISKVYIHNNFFAALGSSGLFINNPTPLADGVFTSYIEKNVIQKGMTFVNAGDSIIVRDNIIPGAGIGLDASFVSGAGTFTFQDNNVTSIAACIHISSVIFVANIIHNVCEGSGGTVTGSNGAYIDFDGAVGSVLNRVQVSGNRISPITAGIVGIRVNRVDGITIENNHIDRTAGAASIQITTNAVGPNVTIGNNYYSPTNDLITSVISDATGLGNTIAFPPMSTSANGGISSGIDFYKPIGFVNGLVVGAGQGILSSAGGGAFIVPSISTPGNLVGTTAAQTITNKTDQTVDGTNSAPSHSFVNEPTSGWFRQQAGIFGFAVGTSYITQYTAGRTGNAPGLVLGWAAGAPNSNSDDATISRKQANILQIGNGSTGNGGGLALNNIVLGTDTAFTAGPRMLWTTYINGPIPGLTAHSAFTPDKAWTLIRIDVNWQVATANCTVAPTITITDGTTPSTMSITNATVYQTATFNQNYAGGTKLQVNLTSGTCTTVPNSSMVTFQFKSQ